MEISKNSKPQHLTIYTDGGARGNPGPGACACVIEDSAGKLRLLSGKYLGITTNNAAEYQGVILAFEELVKIKENLASDIKLEFRLDSSLVVNQLNGIYKVKDKNIRAQVLRIRQLEAVFPNLSYRYIPREQNKTADALVNETLDKAVE